MSKQDILNKFEAAAQCGNSPQAIAYLNELRRDYLDMYFVKEEFTQELIKMFSKKWDKKCSQLWGDVYTHFSALIVPHDLLTGMLRNIRFYNFWIYESFVHAGAM